MASDDELEGDSGGDPDRAAILARRRRFVALAISGLASSGCTGPTATGATGPAAEPCLNMRLPDGREDEGDARPPGGPDGPIVEDPGAALESEGESEGETEGETEDAGPLELPPQVCLKFVVPQPSPKPRVDDKKRPSPQPCLLMME